MPSHGADEHKEPHPDKIVAARKQREPLDGVDHRRRVAHHRLPGNYAAEHQRHSAVEHGAGHQRGHDAEG